MTQQSNLLLDLSTLLTRYPADEWKQLVHLLEDEKSREQILALLRTLETLARISRTTTPGTGNESQKARSSGIGEDQSRKIALELSKVPTAKLREIATKTGIKASSKDSRERIINRLVLAIGDGPVKSATYSRSRSKTGRESEYENWVKIIMGR